MLRNKLNRRSFVKDSIKGISASTLFAGMINFSCKELRLKPISGTLTGPDMKSAHTVRNKMEWTPDAIECKKVVIVGAGISGLSAGRSLLKAGLEDFVILDLEATAGGNSRAGHFNNSAYPLGAHYLPLPNLENKSLLDFLKEIEVISGYDEKGFPYYNEEFLCFAPHERLFIRGNWQEGLVPMPSWNTEETEVIRRFFNEIKEWKNKKKSNGDYLFTIPSSPIPVEYSYLDQQSFGDFLRGKKMVSDCLFWYLDYCCKDDYGCSFEETSAWAGLHYFASRRGVAANAESNSVLTWPEGNAFLANRLANPLKRFIKTSSLVTSVSITQDGKVNVSGWHIPTNKGFALVSDAVIMATPQFVNKFLLHQHGARLPGFYRRFQYAPWMIANVYIRNDYFKNTNALAWDNVLFKGKSLGYVNSTHQKLQRFLDENILTFYFPLTEGSPENARKNALQRTWEDWKNWVLDEICKMHPDCTNYISEINIWLWGHGMIQPKVGFISDPNLVKFGESIDGRIYFAHTDLRGISIFEEGFFAGEKAAEEVQKNLSNKS